MSLNPEIRASCANPEYDPEWWYPEAPEGSGRKPEYVAITKKTIATAVKAMQICQECPLFKDNSCLDYAMENTTTIDYGIFASTLPVERRKAVNQTVSAWDKSPMFIQIRHEATRAGVLPVKIAPTERPKVLRLQILENARNYSSSDLSEQQ